MKKTDKMNKIWLFVITLLVNTAAFSQQKDEARILLDAVSTTMKSYNNMALDFSTSLTNEEAGIYEGDELPTKGSITLQGEKYNLNYLGNTFMFNGLKLYVINHDEKEIMINDEYLGEEGGTSLDIDISDRDKLFKDAAEIIVIAQQGSASLLQRKLKLGYNRAGRLIDQLEAAGIVGNFEGSKARQVLIQDLAALEQLLENEKNI